MLISKKTIAGLCHLANVGGSIGVVPPGNVLATRTAAVLGELTTDEIFPLDFFIPDCHEFIRVLKLFRHPLLSFEAGVVRVTGEDVGAEAFYSWDSRNEGTEFPIGRKKKGLPAEHLSFALGKPQWQIIQKTLADSGPYGASRHRTLTIANDGNTLRAIVHSGFDPERVHLSLPLVSDTWACQFIVVYSADHLRLSAGAYEVTVTPNYARFVHTGGLALQYYVGSQPHLSSWAGRRAYQVQVTRRSSHICNLHVQATSPQEAETLARQMPQEEMGWTGDPIQATEYRVLPI